MYGKWVVLAALAAILYNLARALGSLIRSEPEAGAKMVSSLTWRVSLSLLLFVGLFVGFYFGWLQPHSL